MKPSFEAHAGSSPRRLRIARRRFLQALLFGTPAVALADGLWVEPNWLVVRELTLAKGTPKHRLQGFHSRSHRETVECSKPKLRPSDPWTVAADVSRFTLRGAAQPSGVKDPGQMGPLPG